MVNRPWSISMPLLVAVMRLVAVDVVYISKVWSSDLHFEQMGSLDFTYWGNQTAQKYMVSLSDLPIWMHCLSWWCNDPCLHCLTWFFWKEDSMAISGSPCYCHSGQVRGMSWCVVGVEGWRQVLLWHSGKVGLVMLVMFVHLSFWVMTGAWRRSEGRSCQGDRWGRLHDALLEASRKEDRFYISQMGRLSTWSCCLVLHSSYFA